MTQDAWSAVDAYIDAKLCPPDTALESALAASAKAGLRPISVTASHGKLLHILALSIGARRILEVGTLGGYSAIWMARALPDGGRLTTLEIDLAAAKVARAAAVSAGLADKIEVIVGPAIEMLPTLEGPFDLAFIDANKDQNPEYFEEALHLVRPGGLIVVDNVVRDGAVLDAASKDPNVQGVRRLFDRLAAEPGITVTALQTVGAKGYDGLAIARVN